MLGANLARYIRDALSCTGDRLDDCSGVLLRLRGGQICGLNLLLYCGKYKAHWFYYGPEYSILSLSGFQPIYLPSLACQGEISNAPDHHNMDKSSLNQRPRGGSNWRVVSQGVDRTDDSMRF